MITAKRNAGARAGGRPLPIASERDDRKWRRALRIGYGLAVVVHLAVLLFFRTTRGAPPSPFSAAGPRTGDVRAAAGGGQGLEIVEVRARQAPAAEEAVPEPVPVPVPEEVVVRPREVQVESVDEAVSTVPPTLPGTGGPGEGGQAGPATGPGTATGTGTGGGGTGEEGASGIVAPRPRGIFIPPAGRPNSARGQEITVWVFVLPNGRVAQDSTRLEPATSDSRYNQRLRRTVSEYVFDPARREGRAVGAWFPFQIIL